MKKKFQFRLESVLKLRTFEEDKAKVELGKVIRKKQLIIDQIKVTENDISLTYDSYEKTQNQVVNSRLLSFFPNYIKSLKNKIKNLKNDLEKVEMDYQTKLEHLAQTMGDKKVIEKLKTKKKDEHNKKINKKLEEEREELFMIRRRLTMDGIR